MNQNMEELFCKAAEAYPLKKGDDQWAAISSKLSGNSEGLRSAKKNSNRKYFIVLLFMFLFVSDGFYVFIFTDTQNKPIVVKRQKVSMKKPVSLIAQDNILPHETLQKKIAGGSASVYTRHSLANANQTAKNGNLNLNRSTKTKNNYRPINLLNADLLYNVSDNAKRKTSSIAYLNSFEGKHSLFNKDRFSFERNSRVNKLLPLIAMQHKINETTRKPGLYYGLVAGPAMNAIEDQKMEKPGFDLGLIAGYRFSKKLSIETGILYSQKFYTTAGKYFNMKKIGSTMPAGMEVKQVQGSSRVIEIPLHFQYSLLNNSKNRFYSSAGFSSYLMTSESNKYFARLNGVDEKLYGLYKKNRGYFASTLDLSIGFEQKFGKKNNIRLEPYIQIPFRGMGVGSLQIMSTGLHIGITRSVH